MEKISHYEHHGYKLFWNWIHAQIKEKNDSYINRYAGLRKWNKECHKIYMGEMFTLRKPNLNKAINLHAAHLDV